jgi:hypothetical protein
MCHTQQTLLERQYCKQRLYTNAQKLSWTSAAQYKHTALEQQDHPSPLATMELPSTSDDQIAQFQAEYQAAFNAGSQDELEAAKCR